MMLRFRSFALGAALWLGLASPALASQATLVTPGSPLPMTSLASFLNNALLSIGSCNSGNSAPANGTGNAAFAGECWINTTANPWVFSYTADAVHWSEFGTLNTSTFVWTFTNGTSTALLNTNNLSDLSSAATARTNLGLGNVATQNAGTGLANSGANLNLQPAAASTIGGVESITCATHLWLNMISTAGIPACAQVGFADLSGALATAQLPALTSAQIWVGNGSNVATAVTVSGDCTLSSSGALTCTKTNGTSFGPFATIASQTANAIYKGNGTSAPVASGLTDNGAIVSSSESIDTTSNAHVQEIANAGTTGTTVNKVAKLTGAPSTAVIATTSDTAGNVIGIVTGGAGTTGNAQIAIAGQASCVFDGAITSGHYVQVSTTSGGSCHDAGATLPTSSQILGIIIANTNASPGSTPQAVTLFPPGIVGSNASSAGTVTSITPGGGSVSSTTGACSQTAITTTGTLSAAECLNAQTGTSYAIQDSDRAKLITASNTAAQAYTIAQAGASSNFQGGWVAEIRNIQPTTQSAAIVTITPTTSTICGQSSVKIYPGQSLKIVSDGTNYQCPQQQAVSGDWVLLNTLTANNTAPNLDDTTSLTAIYNEYEIELYNLTCASSAQTIEFNVQSGGSFQGASYLGQALSGNGTSAASQSVTNGVPIGIVSGCPTTAPGISGTYHLNVPSGTSFAKVINGFYSENTTGPVAEGGQSGGYWNSTAAITGLRIITTGGNLATGTFKIYGRL